MLYNGNALRERYLGKAAAAPECNGTYGLYVVAHDHLFKVAAAHESTRAYPLHGIGYGDLGLSARRRTAYQLLHILCIQHSVRNGKIPVILGNSYLLDALLGKTVPVKNADIL